ncbi:hypothetical protein FA13DRAFT_1739137 [Coprinellus micaceus]|uniref:Uncharacterized protein n=1 Tax=Coprinellus micaceus TaxID=71717 RepID=A0A4Y7SS15_COPMI|nr:hypothetical protein FA13DRAFT_1739137 [Coprinellus micaceus]
MEREAKEAKHAEHAEAEAAVTRLWSKENTSSSTEPSPYDPPELDAYLYHCGVYGSDCLGPKLVYRTSRDKEPFTPPVGPDAPRRLMSLRRPPQNHRFTRDNLWEVVVGHEAIKLLDKHDIRCKSLQLVRFAWEAESDEEATRDANGYYVSGQDGPLHITPVTIWVGVDPGSTTGEKAHHASAEILALLRQHDVTDVEVAYHELEIWSRWP